MCTCCQVSNGPAFLRRRGLLTRLRARPGPGVENFILCSYPDRSRSVRPPALGLGGGPRAWIPAGTDLVPTRAFEPRLGSARTSMEGGLRPATCGAKLVFARRE